MGELRGLAVWFGHGIGHLLVSPGSFVFMLRVRPVFVKMSVDCVADCAIARDCFALNGRKPVV